LEALQVYARAVRAEREGRLLEAITLHENARRLDPDATAPRRSLATLYIALDRGEDAIAECRRVLELDTDDSLNAVLLGRVLRHRSQHAEAVAILSKAAETPGLKEQLDVYIHLYFDLGTACEEINDLPRAESSLRRVIEVLEKPAALLESGEYTLDEI